jgi:GNAT superfamily N-acetyltransferase
VKSDPLNSAPVKRYQYDSHDQLRQHLSDFVVASNFGRRLKTLEGLTPDEFICKTWSREPARFRLHPLHQMPGPNIYLVPQERGRGIGTRVLRSLELIAGSAGCSALHLELVAGNGVRSFYQQAGFSDRGSTFLSKRLTLARNSAEHFRTS